MKKTKTTDESREAKLERKKARAERRAQRANAKAGGRRVILSYSPERHGTVVEQGAEAAIVRWDDGLDMPHCVTNKFLINEKETEK
jgi:hypothetical protein